MLIASIFETHSLAIALVAIKMWLIANHTKML
jgi:hypothetical protein